MFGLLERLSSKGRRRARAKKKELEGDLHAAAELYAGAEMPGDAARVLLLKAGTETSIDKRLALLAHAARVGTGTEHGREARRRKAVLGFDLLRTHHGGALRGELLRAAAELEEAGCWEQAAEAYDLAGDQDAEIRVLSAAGAIDKLEQKLQASSLQARKDRDRRQLVQRLRDLDAFAERRSALEHARGWLREHDDEEVRRAAQRIRDRLLRGPDITLIVQGETRRYVLGSSLTVGRAGADVVIPSGSISRQHLRLFRQQGTVYVEDMATRNGTKLGGARISAPLPVNGPLALRLAGQVSCQLTLEGDMVALQLPGERYLLPLGPLRIGDWLLTDAHDGDDRFVVLRTAEGGTPPHTDTFRLAACIELCRGDRLRTSRTGPVVLAVPEHVRRSVA